MKKIHTHYDSLDVSRSATFNDIRMSYHKLAKIYHPDCNLGTSQQENTEKMAIINNAYEILSNPEKRKQYDIWVSEQENNTKPNEANFEDQGGNCEQIICHTCNTKLSKDVRFCPNCGTKVIENLTCYSCGRKKSSTDNFCSHCGYSQQTQVNINFYNIFFAIFPNMKDIKEMERLAFWESNLLAICYTFAIGFPFMLLLSFFDFPEKFTIFLVKTISIVAYIRVSGHAFEGRIRNISLFESTKIRNSLYKFLFICTIFSVIFNAIYIILFVVFLLFSVFLGLYPPKKATSHSQSD